MVIRKLSYLSIAFILFYCTCARAQEVPTRLRTGYEQLDSKLAGMIRADNYAISAKEAASMDNVVYLDAREREEFAVSHLPAALHIGYDDVNYSLLEDLNRDGPVVVYCTVGYRSERIADDLRERGFNQVYNLYGSLYAWKLAGYPLLNDAGEETEEVHTYNRKWGRLVPDSIGKKVY